MVARPRRSTKDRDLGFTLIELLVATLSIATLAVITIPVFLSRRNKAFDASMRSDLKSSATKAETYCVDNGPNPRARRSAPASTRSAATASLPPPATPRPTCSTPRAPTASRQPTWTARGAGCTRATRRDAGTGSTGCPRPDRGRHLRRDPVSRGGCPSCVGRV